MKISKEVKAKDGNGKIMSSEDKWTGSWTVITSEAELALVYFYWQNIIFNL